MRLDFRCWWMKSKVFYFCQLVTEWWKTSEKENDVIQECTGLEEGEVVAQREADLTKAATITPCRNWDTCSMKNQEGKGKKSNIRRISCPCNVIGYWDLKNCNLFVPVIVVFTLSTIFSQFLLPEISSSAPALTKQNVDSSLVIV